MTTISAAEKERLDKLFEEAINLRDAGKLRESLDKLNEILSQRTKYDAVVLTVMGDVYWDLNELSEAIKCFKKAVELNPKSEKVSLGLFHTLWDMKQFDAAHAEMQRFLSTLKPDENVPEGYSLLLDEMQDKLEKAETINKL